MADLGPLPQSILSHPDSTLIHVDNSQLTILHCADLHLDAVLGDSINAKQLADLSKEEITKLRDAPLLALTNIADIAISQKVDVVLIAGDVFNRRDGVSSDIRTRSSFTNFLRTLSDNSIQVFIALGNHDPLGTISDLSAPWPENVHLFSSRAPQTHTLEIDGIQVSIHGVSYQNNEESRNLAELFPPKVNDSINIGVLHTNVGGNENHSNYAPANLETLSAKGYDYFALGHIHKRSVLNEHPFIIYSGNTQALSSKPSESAPKGCVVARIGPESKAIEYEFFTTDSVRYKRIDIEVSQDLHFEDFASHISNEISKETQDYSIFYLVRLYINLAGHNEIVDTNLLRDLINEQRSNFIVTKLEATSSTDNQNIFTSHTFFEILSNDLKNIDQPSLEEMYGKKYERISSLIETTTTNADLESEVRKFVEQTYMEQSNLTKSYKK